MISRYFQSARQLIYRLTPYLTPWRKKRYRRMTDPARDVFTPDGRKILGARKVLPGDTPDDFLAWSFEITGENPLTWQASARNLLEAADAVKARVLPIEGGGMHMLATVQAMLLGMALECLFKGIYIKRHRVWEEADKAHALVRDGQYVGMPDVGEHQLLQMADAASVKLNAQERRVVSRLTDFILYAGRYPIPVRVENMRPVKAPSRRRVSRSYITPEELALGEALAARLMREVEPW